MSAAVPQRLKWYEWYQQPNGKVAGSGENGVLNRRVTKP